ncbi:single-stranded DNA-binding protein [Aeromicrobium sp. Leaf291]|uniref:single-stranded DNA-binding protein n=1 Tax=Aeromicrobium sp. Leaf291 TaxID=1736325 RepID=UPI0006F5FEDF|nr:single-stranded DNA-binding protein [Aeromicrobium sp. Leaf291]KQP81633.1 single-stranded DNA-binding protein [Aeromicrobium sp. Leaf291]
MAGETVITVVGNLTADPELKFTPSGDAVANFTVASTPRSFDKQSNEWKDGNPLFIRCSVWRQMAEHVSESLSKGSHVIVHGALNVRQYDRQEGGQGTSVEMNVYEVGASLRFASTSLARPTRAAAGSQASAGPVAQAQPPFGGGQQAAPASSNPWDTGR